MSGIWDRIGDILGQGKRGPDKREDDKVMYIVAGLGGPIREYEKTRHNVGFEVTDVLTNMLGTAVEEKRFKGLYGRGIIGGERILFLKPQTFTNLDGKSIKVAADFYKVDHEHIIIVYDDISLDVGWLRIRKKGSVGDHNGIKNIITYPGAQGFLRVRVGVDDRPKKVDLADYVLSRLSKEDYTLVEDVFKDVSKAANVMTVEDVDAVTNQSNGRKA